MVNTYTFVAIGVIIAFFLIFQKHFRLGITLVILIVVVTWIIQPEAYHERPLSEYKIETPIINDERYIKPELPTDLIVKQKKYENEVLEYEAKLARYEVLKRERYIAIAEDGHRYRSFIINDKHWYHKYKSLTCEDCWFWCEEIGGIMPSMSDWEGIIQHENKERIIKAFWGSNRVMKRNDKKWPRWVRDNRFDRGGYWIAYSEDNDGACNWYSATYDQIRTTTEGFDLNQKITCICVED